MRFLANENIPLAVVFALREAGHDVEWIRTRAPGACDQDVLTMAVRKRRVLLTFDQDFGELAWRARLPSDSGIVLLRVPMRSPTEAAKYITSKLAERSDWMGHFSVIQPGRIRMPAFQR